MALRNVARPTSIAVGAVELLVVLAPDEAQVDGASGGKSSVDMRGVDNPGGTETRLVAVCGEAGSQSQAGGVSDRSRRGCMCLDAEPSEFVGEVWGWHGWVVRVADLKVEAKRGHSMYRTTWCGCDLVSAVGLVREGRTGQAEERRPVGRGRAGPEGPARGALVDERQLDHRVGERHCLRIVDLGICNRSV